MIHLGLDSNFYDSKKENFEDDGATAILQIAFLNRDLLTCWYRLACSLFFRKHKANLGLKGSPNLSHFR